ncbi:MAG: glucosaminidase domain-containing protein [Pseudohongiellaceae bacterium]|nr:glucosaminidase domain-containing protein [Pseudohongiellaceae bacterium]
MLNYFANPNIPTLARFVAVVAVVSLLIAVPLKLRQQGEVPEVAEGTSETVAPELPDFEAITDVEVKKHTFFTFLHQYIERQNELVLNTREHLQRLNQILSSGTALSDAEREGLMEIARSYRLRDFEGSDRELVDELLVRADIIPDSIALAQAANESAWGTSRFAKEGNNIFGQWCFDEGCGLVPGRRAEDASHEVRAFASVQASVRSYVFNLNTNPAYEYFRELRAQMRYLNVDLDAHLLTEGLTRYSERGALYVAELRDIIRINDLVELYEQG